MSLVAGLLAATGVGPAIAQALRRTPAQVPGPFYPVIKPPDQNADLTTIAGKTGRAAGQLIHVGRVINRQGQPVFCKLRGANRERLIVQLLPPSEGLEPDSLLATWDIVLDEG
jgi:hypothetical protein